MKEEINKLRNEIINKIDTFNKDYSNKENNQCTNKKNILRKLNYINNKLYK